MTSTKPLSNAERQAMAQAAQVLEPLIGSHAQTDLEWLDNFRRYVIAVPPDKVLALLAQVEAAGTGADDDENVDGGIPRRQVHRPVVA